MRLRILRNLGDGWPPLAEGQAVELPEAQALPLVQAGLAELLPGEEPAEAAPLVVTHVPPKRRGRPKKAEGE